MPEAGVRDGTSAALAAAPSLHDDRPVAPPGRMPVAVLVSRFPLVTETFVLRELIELERQGQPVVLVPLLRQEAAVVHPDARPWMERALYTPFVSRGIAAANWRTLRRRPFTYLRLLFQLVRGNAGSPGMLLRTLALFPKTVFLAERLAALGVGHVHAHFATHPAMAAYAIHRLSGLPYSITAHAHDIFVRRDMLREKLAAARFVRCISEFNRQYLAAYCPESRDRLSVMHVGVSVDTGAARARAAPARERRVLCVAALKPYKGHAVLVEACRRLAERRVEFVCDLVGEGPLRPRLEAAIAAAGLQERVRVLGARPEHEVAVLMAGAAVVVQPSVIARDGQMEGIPVALMEAMAAGKPVVASALSGVPELVEDGVSGLLVAPGDAEALAIALERLLNGPQVARSMGEQGRLKVAREFDLTDTVAQLRNAMDRHLPPPPATWRGRRRLASRAPAASVDEPGAGDRLSRAAEEVGGGVEAGRGLGRIAARGAAWSLVGTVGARLVSLLSLAVLARLLSPADFGLVAFALVYITYLETVADLGTGAALIWWPGRREDAAQAAFVLNAGLGLVWVALTLAAAPHVAAFFRTPAGEPVLQALAWVFLLKALGSTHDALSQKELRFRARVAPELGSGTVKAVVAIGLAASGFGAWSLVWGQLAGQAVWTALMWRVVPWRPRWRWPRGLLSPMLRYGRGIVAVNVLSAVVHHADLVVVGRLLGATALGMYQVAYKLPEAAITVLVWVTSRVLFPTLSRLNADSAAVGRGWLAAVRYTSLLTFPAAAGLAVCAAPVVHLVFGDRWLPAAPVLAGLAVAAGLRSAGSNAGDVLKAAGRPGLLAALGVVKAIALVPALVMAAPRGPAAVAWTLAAVTAFNAVLSVAVSSRLAAVSVGDYARAVGPAAGVAGCVALAAWSALRFAPAGALPAAVMAGIAAHLLGTRAFAPDALRGAVEAFRGEPAEGAGGARRAGRIVVGTGARSLLDFAARELLVPHTRAERLVRALSPAAARALLLRRNGLPPDVPWMSAAVAVTIGLGPLRGALEQRRFILSERVEGGRSAGGLVLLFDSGSAEPRAALKVRPAGGPLWREHETLMELHSRLPPALAHAVPRPIGYREKDAWEALLLPWHRGHSPYVEMQRRLRPARLAGVHLQAAARWLAEFHAATREPAEPRHDEDVPLAFGHGDYWPRNLLLQGDAVAAVLDWERSGPGRPVTEDVFHFALTYALNFRWTAAGRVAPDEAFRRGFLRRGPVSAEIGRFLRSYCTAMRLAPRRLGRLFERQLPTLSEVAGLPTETAAALRRRWATARWSVFEG